MGTTDGEAMECGIDRLGHRSFQDGRLSLFTAFPAFIALAIEILYFDMGRDVDDFGADEFFSYRGKFTATRRADLVSVRQRFF